MTLIPNDDTVSNLESNPSKTKLPSISIVIPNFNGGQTLAKTIESIINQQYPELEIIVIDGGSTDNSLDVIKEYDSYLSLWVSEKDNGQSDAINKGFSKCTGEIVNWLCSDDQLLPGALLEVGQRFATSPEIDILAGSSRLVYIHENNRVYIKRPTPKRIKLMPARNAIAQPSCFYRRKLLNRSTPIDESYHYAMDFELWNYFKSLGATWACTDTELSVAFQDGRNKSSTGGDKVTLELERIYNTYVNEFIPLTFWHRRLRYPLEKFLAHHPNRLWLCTIGSVWVGITLLLSIFYGLERTWIMRWKRWA